MRAKTQPKSNLLLTGLPGVGKTTVLRRVAEALRDTAARGFLTDEIRVKGKRLGFRITSLSGKSATLSHVEIRGGPRVGRYVVDLSALEEIAAEALSTDPPAEAYIVDEIGKMECFSPEFVEAMQALLESESPLVATVALKGGGFIRRVKRRRDVVLWEVTRGNRDDLPKCVLDWLRERI
jgi:nucleoside-triphosphatase